MNNLLTSFGQPTQINNSEFIAFKENAMNSMGLYTVPASELMIDGDNLIFKGRKMFLESKKPFMKLLSNASLNKIAKSTNSQMIDSMINASQMVDFLINTELKSAKNRNISLRFDANKNLTAVKLVTNSVTPEKYFKLVDHVMNTYSGLEIDQMTQSTRGEMGISFRSTNEIGVIGNEIFKSGFTLGWDGEVEFNPYLHRLFCTNGMRVKEKSQSYELGSTHVQAWNTFLGEIANAAARNFLPENFVTNVTKAVENNASLAEIEFAYKLLKSAVGDDAEAIHFDGTDWDYKNICASFERAGIPIIGLTEKQKQNLRGPVTMMNLINEVTDIASHDLFDVESGMRERMRIQAGKMLTKELDTEALMFQVF